MAIVSTHAIADEHDEMLNLVNAERREVGCPALKYDSRLDAAAEAHARAMSERNFFAHKDPGGKSVGDRVRAEKYTYLLVGENIAAGQVSVRDAMDTWMASPGHRANILSCGYTDFGMAHVYDPDDRPLRGAKYAFRHYWVQVFGREMKAP